MNRKQAIRHMAQQSVQNIEDADRDFYDLRHGQFDKKNDRILGIVTSILFGIFVGAVLFMGVI